MRPFLPTHPVSLAGSYEAAAHLVVGGILGAWIVSRARWLLITAIGPLAPTLLVVGVITYLLVYAVALIRDIDNPFEYRNGRPGAADVDLGVLERCEARLRSFAEAAS